MFNEKIKPPLVLTLICLITCGLLVAAYEATYVDNTGIITDKLSAGLTEIYGSSEGFEMLKNDDGTLKTYDKVSSVLSDGNVTAFEITEDGYSTGGLHVLVGVDGSGKVAGISILTIGETPGLGTKVQDSGFKAQFTGLDLASTASSDEGEPVKASAVWGTRDKIDRLKAEASNNVSSGFTLDAVTGATLSSNGMYAAVKDALAAYDQLKGGNN